MWNINNKQQKSNHSRVLSYEKTKLQVVAEQEKEKSSNNNGVNEKSGEKERQLILNAKEMDAKILDYETQRKSLSMDKKDDQRRSNGVKDKFKVNGRGGSMRGVDLDKLKIFVDNDKAQS